MIQISVMYTLFSCSPDKTHETGLLTANPIDSTSFSCPRGEEQPSLGIIQSSSISETSGIGQSKLNPDIIWVHNDSGDGALLYATSMTGESIGTVNLQIQAEDWEDMSTIQIEDSPAYIYVGDIGDNYEERESISIHRITESESMDENLSFVTFTVSYTDGPHNAETLVVHPITGKVYVLTKDINKTQIFVLNEEENTLEEVNRFSFSEYEIEGSPLVTGGDISPDGSILLLRTYTHIWALDSTILDGAAIDKVCSMPGAPEEQGEAIAFLDNGRYITISEGDNPTIYQFSYSQE